MTAPGSLAKEYSASSDAYARRWAPVIAPMAKPIFGALPLAEAATVHDVGAGTGAMLPHVRAAAPRANVVGLERAEVTLDVATPAGWRALATADAQKLPARSAAVDVGLL